MKRPEEELFVFVFPEPMFFLSFCFFAWSGPCGTREIMARGLSHLSERVAMIMLGGGGGLFALFEYRYTLFLNYSYLFEPFLL